MKIRSTTKALAVTAGVAAMSVLGASQYAFAAPMPSFTYNAAVAASTPRMPNSVNVSFNVVQTAGPQAVATNLARATASYVNGGRSIAIAFQIDLVSDQVSGIRAYNTGVAAVTDTVNTQVLAAAHQFVVSTGGDDVSLNAAGTAALNSMKAQLIADAYNPAVPAWALQDEVDSDVGQIQAILTTDVTSTNPTAPTQVSQANQDAGQ